jgi:hypothetical protein
MNFQIQNASSDIEATTFASRTVALFVSRSPDPKSKV